jgi:PAS domain S-box-containing protein
MPKTDLQAAAKLDTALRRRAEDIAWAELRPGAGILHTYSPTAVAAMLHELRVHQIELDMQNDELRRVQLARDIERQSYVDLYDLAPVGYCTLSSTGLILQANLSCADMLGLPRQALIDKPIFRFILKEDQDNYYRYRKQRGLSNAARSCELQIASHDCRVCWVQLEATKGLEPDGSEVTRLVLSDITQRKQADKKRVSQSLQIEELSRRLVQSQEDARRRFSRELHDRSSPNLAALRINLDMITEATLAQRATQEFADRIEDTRALILDTTLSVREICAELYPPALEAGGLLGVLQSYAQPFSKRTGLQVQIQCPHGDLRLPLDLELALFRIVQEALTNSAKHANATQVMVRLQLDLTPKLLSVLDDGDGFELDPIAGSHSVRGQGLRNMKETAEFVGGRFTLESLPGRGTRVFVEI